MKRFIKRLLPPQLLSFYHFILSFLGALIYRFPSRNLILIGVTGTNGKTTTTEMIAKIFETIPLKVALLNSLRFKIGEKSERNTLRMTMPGRFFIQRFLRNALREGCRIAILEVTSEGIKQYRHCFLNFHTAVFLNLAPEHIESHGSFEKYRNAKMELFKKTRDVHIINIEDEHSKYFLNIPSKRKITFGIESGDFNFKNTNLNICLPGIFNLYNALAAYCVGVAHGVEEHIIRNALENFGGVPGRLETVISKPFRVIVDYAFTPFALEKVYQTLKPKNGKLICVLGAAGGGRDKWKRPVLGEIAEKYCDEIIITNEDPYDEDEWAIIEQVASGAGGRAKKILDRGEAISVALMLAKEGDTVIITGKGCEPSICIKGEKIPWDDREVVRERFQRLIEKK